MKIGMLLDNEFTGDLLSGKILKNNLLGLT